MYTVGVAPNHRREIWRACRVCAGSLKGQMGAGLSRIHKRLPGGRCWPYITRPSASHQPPPVCRPSLVKRPLLRAKRPRSPRFSANAGSFRMVVIGTGVPFGFTFTTAPMHPRPSSVRHLCVCQDGGRTRYAPELNIYPAAQKFTRPTGQLLCHRAIAVLLKPLCWGTTKFLKVVLGGPDQPDGHRLAGGCGGQRASLRGPAVAHVHL